MTPVTNTKNMVGRSIGSVIRRKRCQDVAPLVLLQLGFTAAATFNAEFHGYPASLWWPWALLGALIVLAAGFYGVRTSARLGTVLGLFEIGVFLVLAIFLLVHAGSHNTLSV